MQRSDDEAVAYRRFEQRLTVLWTAVTYATTGLGLWGLQSSRPERLQGWALVGLVALLALFFAAYHLGYLRAGDFPPYRFVAAYGAVQALILLVLLQVYTPEFLGMGIALAIQLMAVLPARAWWAPAAGLIAIALSLFDLSGSLTQGDLDLIVMLGIQIVVWLSVFGVMLLLMRQRQRLAELVEELRLAQQELRRAAAQANELAVLRERTRLAREMHDSLGHALVTVNVKLEVVERLYARDAERGVAELRATRDLVRQAMVDLRHSLDDLRGPMPASRDLPVDLQRRMVEFQERTRIVATGEVKPEVPELAPDLVAAIWAVLREALQNVERHAGAGSVEATISRQGERVLLRVADDGVGVSAADLARAGRHGITGMRERSEALGGTLRVDPRPGGGTVVEAAFPLIPGLADRDPEMLPAATSHDLALERR